MRHGPAPQRRRPRIPRHPVPIATAMGFGREADAAVVSTGDDITASILATMALTDLGIDDVYVKVISKNHARVMVRIGVTETVFPERESGINLASRISEKGVLNYVRMARNLSVQELVVRMLRMEARRVLLQASRERSGTDPLAAAVEYAKAHLDEPLTVADLAAVACMSESTFYRYFRDQFGQTPLAYLTEQRVRRACRLLTERRRTVSDVAAAVGFSSPSHFIRLFRRHTGQTPKQYQLARLGDG